MTCFEVLDGVTFEPLHRVDLNNAREEFGAPLYTVHRVDLHNELIHLSSALDYRLSSRVVEADAEEGSVLLEDGTRHHADLIIAADGLHSVLRSVVVGDEKAAQPTMSGMNAFRFMIPTSILQNDQYFREIQHLKGNGNSVLADTKHHTERHMVWYTCREYVIPSVGLRNHNYNNIDSGQVQNFAGIYPDGPLEGREDKPKDGKALAL